MRRIAPILIAAALAAMLVPAGQAAKTFGPKGSRLTLRLPNGWKTTHPETGWRFEAVAPNFHAWVFLSARPAAVSDVSYEGSFVSFERKQSDSLGPHVIFRSRRTTIGKVPAIETSASGRGTTTQFAYGFQDGGLEYVLVYVTTSQYLVLEKPAFAASARSVRFLDAP